MALAGMDHVSGSSVLAGLPNRCQNHTHLAAACMSSSFNACLQHGAPEFRNSKLFQVCLKHEPPPPP